MQKEKETGDGSLSPPPGADPNTADAPGQNAAGASDKKRRQRTVPCLLVFVYFLTRQALTPANNFSSSPSLKGAILRLTGLVFPLMTSRY